MALSLEHDQGECSGAKRLAVRRNVAPVRESQRGRCGSSSPAAGYSGVSVPALNLGGNGSGRREESEDYEEYLKKIVALAKKVNAGFENNTPKTLDTAAKRALYENLDQNEDIALRIDELIQKTRKVRSM